MPWKINSLPILEMTPRKISWVGACFLYSMSKNIPHAEHSNVSTCYFIQPEVAVWRNKSLRSQKLLRAEQRSLCSREWKSCHACVSAWAGNELPNCKELGFAKQDKHKETFSSVKEEAGCQSHVRIPWLAYWEFIGWLAHTEILLRNSKGFVGRNIYLKVKRGKWFSFQNTPWLLFANQTVIWKTDFFFCKIHEGKVKDYLNHLSISIIGSGTKTVDAHSVTIAAWESCFSPFSNTSHSMHSWQNGCVVDWKDRWAL